MPWDTKHRCAFPGCAKVIDWKHGYCNQHYKEKWTKVNRKRGGQSDPFYRTVIWQRVRNAFIKEFPFCGWCGKSATLVDHITPRSLGGSDYDYDNLQSLCDGCHLKKTAKESYEQSVVNRASRSRPPKN